MIKQKSKTIPYIFFHICMNYDYVKNELCLYAAFKLLSFVYQQQFEWMFSQVYKIQDDLLPGRIKQFPSQ